MGWIDKIREAFSGTSPAQGAPTPSPEPPPPAPPFRLSDLTAIGVRVSLAQTYLAPLNAACLRFGITSRIRKSIFLAQVAHESGLFVYSRELWGPTAAQSRYEGRADLGNLQPGDGFRFRGRGLIQITGRSNYEEIARAFNLGTINTTIAWLETPEGACMSAAYFWYTRGCNALAEQGDFVGVTRKINGGVNGIQNRFALWHKAEAALSA